MELEIIKCWDRNTCTQTKILKQRLKQRDKEVPANCTSGFLKKLKY